MATTAGTMAGRLRRAAAVVTVGAVLALGGCAGSSMSGDAMMEKKGDGMMEKKGDGMMEKK